MNLAGRHFEEPLMIDELVFALEQTLSGHYADALSAVARAKGGDPRNIYVIAMEKQVARLQRGGMSPEEKTEALETLPVWWSVRMLNVNSGLHRPLCQWPRSRSSGR